MSSQFDYTGTASNAVDRSDDDNNDIDIKPLIEPLAIALIVIGIILFVLAFLGLCGACCDSRLLLAVVSLHTVT